MKPCTKNRKPIALLVLGELEAAQRKSLHSHLEECDGCHHYFEEISGLAEGLAKAEPRDNVQADEKFHLRVVNKLRFAKKRSTAEALLEQFRWLHLNWRWGLYAGGTIVVAIIAMFAFLRPAKSPLAELPTRDLASETRVKHVVEPTLSNYEMVANLSFERFDELLTEQGSKNLSPMPVYRALALPLGTSAE